SQLHRDSRPIVRDGARRLVDTLLAALNPPSERVRKNLGAGTECRLGRRFQIEGEAMRRNLLLGFVVALLALALPMAVLGDVTVAPGGGTPGTARNFQLVGHNPLFNRGMNAALTIFDHYVYIGNRSDGSNSCGDLNGSGAVVPVLTPTNPN